jgi:MFS family permease
MSTPERHMAFGRDVWWIAFSAFFADLGYQMVIAGLPLFLVVTLHAPVWIFGVATALSYGGGSLIAYFGGRLGDRVGHKQIAILGNSLIPILSFTGTVTNPFVAVGLFTSGWWARNFRTPSRRALLTEFVTHAQEARAFGLLHALDVGGGMLAAFSALALVLLHVPFRIIFLMTLLPLAASTVCLALVRAGVQHNATRAPLMEKTPSLSTGHTSLYRGIIVATALYGFSSYSIGFPILTVAQSTHREASGVLAYALFLGVSALTGLAIGWTQSASISILALLGYFASGLGAVGLAVAYGLQASAWGFYTATVVIGLALGVIETMEPALISRVTPTVRRGRGMGALTGARSLGLAIGNLSMGILYSFSPLFSYGYAALVAMAATVVLLVAGRNERAQS